MLICNEYRVSLFQDVDGFHIKGLLISFFNKFWSKLLKLEPSFITDFITPIMNVTDKLSLSVSLFHSRGLSVSG